jgi:hypothetical protein
MVWCLGLRIKGEYGWRLGFRGGGFRVQSFGSREGVQG